MFGQMTKSTLKSKFKPTGNRSSAIKRRHTAGGYWRLQNSILVSVVLILGSSVLVLENFARMFHPFFAISTVPTHRLAVLCSPCVDSQIFFRIFPRHLYIPFLVRLLCR